MDIPRGQGGVGMVRKVWGGSRRRKIYRSGGEEAEMQPRLEEWRDDQACSANKIYQEVIRRNRALGEKSIGRARGLDGQGLDGTNTIRRGQDMPEDGSLGRSGAGR
ncbi:hypothetical protein BKA80DRAFT_273016 [Phyllosticta citrichinensis]